MVNRFVGGRIRPFVVSTVRKGHVADPQPGELSQYGEITVDHVAAFHTHERSDPAFRFCFANFRGSSGQYDVARMLTHLFAHGVDLLESAPYRFGAGNFAG